MGAEWSATRLSPLPLLPVASSRRKMLSCSRSCSSRQRCRYVAQRSYALFLQHCVPLIIPGSRVRALCGLRRNSSSNRRCSTRCTGSNSCVTLTYSLQLAGVTRGCRLRCAGSKTAGVTGARNRCLWRVLQVRKQTKCCKPNRNGTHSCGCSCSTATTRRHLA